MYRSFLNVSTEKQSHDRVKDSQAVPLIIEPGWMEETLNIAQNSLSTWISLIQLGHTGVFKSISLCFHTM